MTRKRKLLLVLSILFLGYLLSGFFLLPLLVKHFALKTIRENISESVTIEKVRTNPFTLELSIEQFDLSETEDDWAVQWERVTVNLSALTLLKFYPVFDEIKIEAPHVQYVRRKNADAKIEADQIAMSWKEIVETISNYEIPEVIIQSLVVAEGTVDFIDETRADRFSQTVTPINFALEEFTTVIDSRNEMRFIARTPKDALVEWKGRFHSRPFSSQGSIRIEGIDLAGFTPYFDQFIQFDLASAIYGMQFDYRFDLSDLNELLVLQNGRISIDTLICREAEGDESILELDSVEIQGVSFYFPTMTAEIEEIQITQGTGHVRRDAEGAINLSQLLAERGADPKSSATNGLDFENPSFRIETIRTSDLSILWEDALSTGPASLKIVIPDQTIEGVNSDLSQPITIRGNYEIGGSGYATLEGTIIPKTQETNFKLSLADIPLSAISPYTEFFAKLSLLDGLANFDGHLKNGTKPLAYRIAGDASIKSLQVSQQSTNAISGTVESVLISDLDLVTEPFSYQLERLEVLQPVFEIVKRPTKDDGTDVPESRKEDNTPAFVHNGSISEFLMANGTIRLRDERIQPSVEILIQDTELKIRDISLSEMTPTAIEMSAKVNQSQLRIEGQLVPADLKKATELDIQIDGLALPVFSPYSGMAVGRNLAKGWFGLEANWSIQGSQLKAKNRMRIRDFELGDSVKNDTAIRLPLDLAVTLLKGPNGDMDLSLPLSGDLSDPKASLGQIIATAFVGLVTNVAAAPFKILSGLVQTEADLSKVSFQPNSHKLDASSIDQLNALAKALTERPQISLAMSALVSVEDLEAISRDQLRQSILAEKPNAAASDYERLLEKAYRAASKENGESKEELPQDESPAQAIMEKALSQRVSEKDEAAVELSKQRLENIRQHFLSQGIESNRVQDSDTPVSINGSIVRFELK